LDDLATLRDSENLLFSVEPDGPDILRNLAGMTKSWEMKGWTREILGYRKVKHIPTYLYGEFDVLNEAAAVIASGGVVFALITAAGLLGTWQQTPFTLSRITGLPYLGIFRFKGVIG
jgi:hypothetical protein